MATVPGCLDVLVERTVPDVPTAVGCNSPLYAVEGQGWFLSVHFFTNSRKLNPLNVASLDTLTPVAPKHEAIVCLDVHERDDLDEGKLGAWVRQASRLSEGDVAEGVASSTWPRRRPADTKPARQPHRPRPCGPSVPSVSRPEVAPRCPLTLK